MRSRFGILLSLTCCFVGASLQINSNVLAQITPDGTTETTISNDGTTLKIEGGNREGNNLFHSFQDFNIPQNGETFFDNAVGISNIINRVTGGNISNINGLIRSNGDANLFLINPAGIVFGSNLNLEIGGSFYGATADSILFPDNIEFSATDLDNAPLLTVNAPIGLRFRDNPASITVTNSNSLLNAGLGINFDPGAINFDNAPQLALIGGDILLDNSILNLDSRQIILGGLASAGIVEIETDGSLSFPDRVTLGNIILNNSELNFNASQLGNIAIDVANLELNNSQIVSKNSNTENSGDIFINARNKIMISGEESGIFGNLEEDITGNAGDINLVTRFLFLENDGELNSSTQGEGNAGSISIIAEEINLDNGEISTEVDEGAVGNAGNINLKSDRIYIRNEAELNSSTQGEGNAGNIAIATQEINLVRGEISTGVEGEARGNAGSINIDTNALSLADGSSIFSAVFGGEGDGGNITISATDFVDIAGINEENFASGLYANTAPGVVGDAGNIQVATDLITLRDRGIITVNNAGEGIGGNLSISGNNLILDNDAAISATNTTDNALFPGGNTKLVIQDTLLLNNNSFISARAFANANAGDIVIDSRFIIAPLNQIQEIFSAAERGSGGNIEINAEFTFGLEFDLEEEGNNFNTLIERSQDLIKTEENIVQACRNDRLTGQASNLIIRGKGGIPPEISQPLNSEAILSTAETRIPDRANIAPLLVANNNIYPARGIAQTPSGKIILTAHPTKNIASRTLNDASDCQ